MMRQAWTNKKMALEGLFERKDEKEKRKGKQKGRITPNPMKL